MAIKSGSEALQRVDHVMHFSQQHGNEELNQTLKTITEKMQDIQITKPTIFTNKLCLYVT